MDSQIRNRSHTPANAAILDNSRGSYQSASQVHSPTYTFGSNHAGNSYLNQQLGSVNQKRVLGLSGANKRKRTPPLSSSSKKDFSGRWANCSSDDFDVSFENTENITSYKPDSTAWSSGVEKWVSASSTSCSRRSPLSSIGQYGDNQVNRVESGMWNTRSLSDRRSPLPTTGSTQVNQVETRSLTGQHSPSPIPGSVQCPYCGNGLWMTEEEFSDHLRDYHLHKYNTCLLPQNHNHTPAHPAPKPPKPKCADCGQEKEDYSEVYQCVLGHKKERERERERLRLQAEQDGQEAVDGEQEKELDGQKFVCPECKKDLKTRRALTQHRNRRHNVVARPAGVEKSKIICEFCLFEFSKRFSLTRHLPVCPKKPKDETNAPPSIPMTPTPILNQNTQPQTQNLPPQNQNPQTQDQNHPTQNQTHPSQPTPIQNDQNQTYPSHPTQTPSHPTQYQNYPTHITSHPNQNQILPTQIPSHSIQNQNNSTQVPSHPTQSPSHPTQYQSYLQNQISPLSHNLPIQPNAHTQSDPFYPPMQSSNPFSVNHNSNSHTPIQPNSFQNSLVPTPVHHSPIQSSQSNLRSQGSFSSVYSIDSSAGII